MSTPPLLPVRHLDAPLMGCSYVSDNKANLLPLWKTRLKALFMDSGLMVQLKGDYGLIISHVSKLLLYKVLTGL